MRRVVPVIERLRAACDVPISIDTTLSVVARAAIAAGAGIVNDVSAGLEDPAMLALAAERSCGLILMHRLARPERERYSHEYERTPEYADVVEEVRRFLEQRAAAAIAAGVPRDAIVIDPGLGFGKSVEQNYRLIRGAGRLLASGFPVLSAASRKSFIGAAAGGAAPADRLAGTLAISLVQALAGVRLFRVHDVQAHRQALAVVLAIGGAAGPAA
jgi:dihydropteroate synthase